MTENRVPLRDSRSIVLDAAGQGSVIFGPGRPNTRWSVQRYSVQVSSNVKEPTANVYRGTPNAGTFVSGTFSGSNDTDSDVNDNPLYPGEYYTCVWTGGDVGAVAIISFGGEEITGY
jgi:hypothetical protein